MIWTVTSSLIGHRVIGRVCARASMKPRGSPMTPSPALASPEPVSQAESVTNQVPLRSRVLTSSAVRIPSSSIGDASPRFQASIVVLAPANAGFSEVVLIPHVFNEYCIFWDRSLYLFDRNRDGPPVLADISKLANH